VEDPKNHDWRLLPWWKPQMQGILFLFFRLPSRQPVRRRSNVKANTSQSSPQRTDGAFLRHCGIKSAFIILDIVMLMP